jgi:hypothetical protein
MLTTFIYNSKDKIGNTGLQVHSGDKLSIDTCIKESWIDLWIPSSLEGFNSPFKLLFPARWKDEKYYCLCGFIGDEKDGNYFKIGLGVENFNVTKSGLLYIFVNDYNANWAYRNNKGIVKLDITIN